MTHQQFKQSSRIVLPLVIFATLIALTPTQADAGYRYFGPSFRSFSSYGSGGGYYSPFYRGRFASRYFAHPYLYGGYGRSGAYGQYGYSPRPVGGLDLGVAEQIGVGGLDLNVKPRKAEVFVNGELVGQGREFDGSPSFLWLKEGTYTVSVAKDGFAPYEMEFTVAPGAVQEIKLQLDEVGSGKAA